MDTLTALAPYVLVSALFVGSCAVAASIGRYLGYRAGAGDATETYNRGWGAGHATGVYTGYKDATERAVAVLATVPRSLGGRAIVKAIQDHTPSTTRTSSGVTAGAGVPATIFKVEAR